MKYTHVLQGYLSGFGWADMTVCKNHLWARAHLQAAMNTNDVWCTGIPHRDMLRIVEIEKANCIYS